MSQQIGIETPGPFAGRDRAWLERELLAANATARDLERRMAKLQQQLAETTRAYNKTVENMQAIVRENIALTGECERWRNNAQRYDLPDDDRAPLPIHRLSPEEVRAIRKAMARLHHPDVGGSVERMKSWNAILDRIEDGRQ